MHVDGKCRSLQSFTFDVLKSPCSGFVVVGVMGWFCRGECRARSARKPCPGQIPPDQTLPTETSGPSEPSWVFGRGGSLRPPGSRIPNVSAGISASYYINAFPGTGLNSAGGSAPGQDWLGRRGGEERREGGDGEKRHSAITQGRKHSADPTQTRTFEPVTLDRELRPQCLLYPSSHWKSHTKCPYMQEWTKQTKKGHTRYLSLAHVLGL